MYVRSLVGSLLACLCALTAPAAVLYQNPFDQASDLDDWLFTGDAVETWQIATLAAGTGVNAPAPSGWGHQKYAQLINPQAVADLAETANIGLRTEFHVAGNTGSVTHFELRQGASFLTGFSVLLNREDGSTSRMRIYDGDQLIATHLLDGNLSGHWDTNQVTPYVLNAALYENRYTVSIYYPRLDRYLADTTTEQTIFSGQLTTALDAGGAGFAITTFNTSTPTIFDYQLFLTGIPEPTTLILVITGGALLTMLRTRLSAQ